MAAQIAGNLGSEPLELHPAVRKHGFWKQTRRESTASGRGLEEDFYCRQKATLGIRWWKGVAAQIAGSLGSKPLELHPLLEAD